MNQSAQLFSRARSVIPGGVNSPVRAFRNVDGDPFFVQSAKGAYITDADGRQLIDYIGTWGPAILGHAPQPVLVAVHAAVDRGLGYGIPAPAEVDMAEMITDMVPSVEKVRMVNSGTEATMSALRLARGYTKRNKVLKFIGCYHGHADPFLAAAGSGVATFSVPGTPGVPEAAVADTLLAPYNDLEACREIFSREGSEIAAVIVEPVAANMGLVLPKPGFLEGLREITRQYGALLIFDEVITGFRASFGGAQARFGIDPDLTTFGKIIGGGLPVGAFGGKRQYMENVAPRGAVYQAGTLSGNPLAMAAGLATLPANCAPSSAPRACPSRCPPSPPCSAPTSASRKWWTSPPPNSATSSCSPPSTSRCASRASSWRPRASRPAWSPSPTPPTTSTRPWTPPARSASRLPLKFED